MRWIFAAVEFFTIGILIAMLFGPSLIDVTAIHGALNLPFTEPGFDGGINFSMRIVLGIIIVASGWDAIKVLLPEFNNKRIALPTVK